MNAKYTFTPYRLGSLSLANRIVMAPMTRSRAINNQPNGLMATYYAQRATAGLIITEGVAPSANGLGYARIPGIFTDDQVQAWRQVTDAVHARGGRIFVQLMHTGRIGHGLNLPPGARVVAPSAVVAPGQMWTDQEGMQNHPVPEALSAGELQAAKEEFVQAARNAVAAGFDGVELHSANGYLLEQFLSPHTNRRTDAYGGSVENRSRFVLETAKAVSAAIGKEKTGIRLSPYGTFNDMPHYPEIDETYTYLAEQLNREGLVYVHLVDFGGNGPEAVRLRHIIREKFTGTLILSGGYEADQAEQDIAMGHTDLVAFGKKFINNPDLVERLAANRPLNLILNSSTFYTPGEKGYVDYPVYAEMAVAG